VTLNCRCRRLFPYELDADKLWEVLVAMELQEKVRNMLAAPMRMLEQRPAMLPGAASYV
jgi:hypothetical protein